MAEPKTKPTDASVDEFLDAIPDEARGKDCREIVKMMKKATKDKPVMWGTSIIGFGSYHYKSKSGCEGDWFITGLSPRKNEISLYLLAGFSKFGHLLEKPGKHKTGVGCLYIKRLADVDVDVLNQLIVASVEQMREHQKCGSAPSG